MKKSLNSYNVKRSRVRSRNSFKRKLKEKAKRKSRRKNIQFISYENYIPSSLTRTSHFSGTEREVLKIAPPSNFSFLDNTGEVLEFIERLRGIIKKRAHILVDLKGVENITNDTIALLLAFIHNPHVEKKCFEIRGNYPDDPKLRKILEESGIFKANRSNNNNYIITRKEKKADGEIAQDVINKVTKAIFGKEGRSPGLYRALMESMANTCYHAKPDRKAYETWWLSIYHNKESDCVSFAFIDIGVGVFRSRKMRIFAEKIKATLGLMDNTELLKNIMEGKAKSSTKLPYRGKGLPAIYKGINRNYYSNLRMITNNVKAEPAINKYEKLDTEFRGTFLYWEYNKTNLWISS